MLFKIGDLVRLINPITRLDHAVEVVAIVDQIESDYVYVRRLDDGGIDTWLLKDIERVPGPDEGNNP